MLFRKIRSKGVTAFIIANWNFMLKEKDGTSFVANKNLGSCPVNKQMCLHEETNVVPIIEVHAR